MNNDLKLLIAENPIVLHQGALPELDELAGKATIIGLGESIHGCGTFHRANYNLARYLITHHGFRIFQLEAPSVSLNPLQAFIDSSVETPTPWLKYCFKTWLSAELMTFLEWLREFNASIFPDRVIVRGYDVQLPWLELNLLSTLNEPPASYSAFMEGHKQHFPRNFTPEDVKAFQTKVRYGEIAIESQILINLREDIANLKMTSPPFLHAYSQDFSQRVLLQKLFGWLEMLSIWQADVPLSVRARDAGMADDILWAVRHFGKKAVVIAHNGHLVYDPAGLLPKTDNQGHGDLMGSHLRQELGDRYHCLTAIGHTLTVWDIPVKETRKIVFGSGLEGYLARELAPIRFIKPQDLQTSTAIIGSPTEWSDPEDEYDHKMEADWTKQTSIFLFIPNGEAFKPYFSK